MTPVLLADDLSGALEAGAAFVRSGWETVLLLKPESTRDRAEASPRFSRLRLISTETRNLPAAAARGAVARELAEIAARSETLLFKKVDSTLRGPVAAELEAILGTISRPVIFSPANPSAGRTVRNGLLLVNGVPIADTAFRSDPLMPVKENSVSRILGAALRGGLAEVPLEWIRNWAGRGSLEFGLLADAGRRVFVCDAETNDDLQRLVASARQAHPEPCFVGSGGLAVAVAGAWPAPVPKPPPEIRSVRGNVLIVSGSKHPISQAQAAAIGQDCGMNLHRLRPGMSDADLEAAVDHSLRANACACVATGLGEDDPARVAATLGRVIGAIDRRQPLAALIVSGGETARFVCDGLDGESLEVLAEIETGAVISELSTPRGVRLLVTKPGGFGREATLTHLYRTLRR